MRKFRGYLIVSAALILCGVWVAAQVNLLEFKPGTPIKSADINANFSVLNEAKQNRVTGTCEAGSSIRSVNADGTVECEADNGGAGAGDIGAVTAGTGLEGGGDSGEVELSLALPFQLPQTCNNGQITEWDGSKWICGSDDVGESGGGGDITGVTVGEGLLGGGESGSVNLSLNTAFTDGRYGYSAGDGLVLNGTTFSVAPAYLLPQDCANGQVIKTYHNGIDTVWHCADDGLTLPFSGSASTPGGSAAFAVEQTNPGGGSAIEVVSGNFGIDIRSAAHVGLNIEAVGGSGIVVNQAGLQGTYGGHGVLVNSAAGNGLHVESAGQYGVRVNSAGSGGFYVGTAPGAGMFVNSANVGVYVNTATAHGGRFRGDIAGVFAMGDTNATPDLILAGNSPTDEDGRIHSDPNFRGSDIFLTSNDAVVVELDKDDDEAGHFQVQNGTSEVVFQVAEDGEVKVNGVTVHSSDRNLKENLESVNPQEVLSALVEMPIHRWNFTKDEADTPHLGPMAQDFYAAFGLGSDKRYIGAIDADGVALAAIKGLYELVQAQQAEIEALKQQVANFSASP